MYFRSLGNCQKWPKVIVSFIRESMISTGFGWFSAEKINLFRQAWYHICFSLILIFYFAIFYGFIYSGFAKVVTAKVVTFLKSTKTRKELLNLLVFFADSNVSFSWKMMLFLTMLASKVAEVLQTVLSNILLFHSRPYRIFIAFKYLNRSSCKKLREV